MILQHIIWPDKTRPETAELYYHADIPVQYTEEGIYSPAPGEIRFDTYFNFFDAKKWRRYSKIQKVMFHIRLRGTGSVRLMSSENTLIAEQIFSGNQEICFSLPTPRHDYYYLSLKLQSPTVIEAGTIETDVVGNDVKLALVICTYNRPKELLRNIALLKERNQETADGTGLLDYIYVVDNARNLDKNIIEGTGIFLIPNKNTGGAGGFTRGMQEAMKCPDLTHIILMDDDVQIEFETFRRTKAFLSYIKSEYNENFLGGAMFRTDIPYILHAAGEDWADGFIRNPYKRMDMRKLEQALFISKPVETKQAYAGWWYCCIPKSFVLEKGYPMPLFLHCDDVEYSLRSKKPPIYLNGVAVWHEEFEDKRNSILEYYDVRNRLITNALYKEHGKRRNALYILCERFYATVFRYRYKDFILSIKAVNDFLKGPKWLKKIDSEALHKSLLEYGYKIKKVKEFPKVSEYSSKKKLITIGRYFFPASGKDVLRMGAPISAYAGKKKLILVELKSKKGFEVEKLWTETMICTKELAKAFLKLALKYGISQQKWLEGVGIKNISDEVDKNTI